MRPNRIKPDPLAGCDPGLLEQFLIAAGKKPPDLSELRGEGQRELQARFRRIRKAAEDVRALQRGHMGDRLGLFAFGTKKLADQLEFFAAKSEEVSDSIRPLYQDIPLALLCAYVEWATGSPHDAAIAERLREFEGWAGYSVEALKTWKSRHRKTILGFVRRFEDNPPHTR